MTFRVTGGSSSAGPEIKELIENDYVKHTQNIVFQGENIAPPKALPFYPQQGMGWQLDLGKSVIRRSKEFARLQRFLVVETEAGNIYRQEAVSMIPPLFLNVEPHHSVIDMCAAPGSKTAQLVEALHKDGPASVPTGFVLANDSDYKRAHMLIHQVKRLNSPNLIVTNHDAQMFPRMKSATGETVKFDRVLCDVPCSGDGTMRKNINVWTDWKVGNGNGLHSTQLNILLRGIQLLKAGGRLVYSTCSLNPIENEAVVAEALRRSGASIHLVDVTDMIPNLVRRKGISTWKVANKQGEWVDSAATEAAPEPVEEGKRKNQAPKPLAASLFPPTEEEAKTFNLEHCVRVYPHLQNTGGFFIAVLEKAHTKKRTSDDADVTEKEESKKPKVEETKTEEASENKTEPESKETIPISTNPNDEVFRFLSSEYPDILSIFKFYGISEESFPGARSTLLVRNATGIPSRAIYYVSPSVKPIIELNDHKVKFVHAGLRIFSMQKSESECPWRVHAEAINIVAPHANKVKQEGENKVGRRYFVAKGIETLKHLIEDEFPSIESIKTVDEDLYNEIKEIGQGAFILEFPRKHASPVEPKEDDDKDAYKPSEAILSTPLLYPVWRGIKSVNLMLSKQDLAELVHRVFGQENIKARKTNNNGGGKPKNNNGRKETNAEPKSEAVEEVNVEATEVANGENSEETTSVVVEELKEEVVTEANGEVAEVAEVTVDVESSEVKVDEA